MLDADQLDGDERAELARAPRERTARAAWARSPPRRAALANLALALDPIEPSTSLRERLRARVLAPNVVALARADPRASSSGGASALAAGIAALVAFGVGTTHDTIQ